MQGSVNLRVVSMLPLAIIFLAIIAPTLATSTQRSFLAFVCTNTYAKMIINNYQKTCDANVNNGCKVPTNCTDYCPACDLYVKHSWVAAFQNKTGFTETSEWGGHRLVLPIDPCRGVEDWKTCGGDPIWDYAWNFAGGSDYGLAINPVQRRTQDQMHVHVAQLQQPLVPVLQQVAKSNNTQWGAIICPDNKIPKGCKYNPNITNSSVQAKFIPSAKSPSAAKPFAQVYGNIANAQNDTTVVSQPLGPGKGVVVLRATDRPAECFIFCQDVCQDKC